MFHGDRCGGRYLRALAVAAMHTTALPANLSIVAMRFHKVGSTNVKEALSAVFGQAAYMEHESLATYRLGGLRSLRCLGAPNAQRVVFVVLFREPAARILSSLFYYVGVAGVTRHADVAHSDPLNAPAAALLGAKAWITNTACSAYTATMVAHHLNATLTMSRIGETYGGGMLLNEYSYYFRVHDKADVAATLDKLEHGFIVGVTENLPALVSELVLLVGETAARKAAWNAMHAQLAIRVNEGKQHPTDLSRDRYCSVRDLPPAVVTDVRTLAGHDVALYDGAVRIVQRQKRRGDVKRRTHHFQQVFKGTHHCTLALPPPPPMAGDELRNDVWKSLGPRPRFGFGQMPSRAQLRDAAVVSWAAVLNAKGKGG